VANPSEGKVCSIFKGLENKKMVPVAEILIIPLVLLLPSKIGRAASRLIRICTSVLRNLGRHLRITHPFLAVEVV
jgi:hypothetical protein